MSTRRMPTRRSITIAILALVCLAACAHHDQAAGNFAQATDARGADVSTDSSSPSAQSSDSGTVSPPSSPPLSPTGNPTTNQDGDLTATAATDSPGAVAAVPPSPAQTGVAQATTAASDEPECITLEAESYCKAWSNDTAVSTQTEYVRSGESVNAWKRMITIVRYKNLGSLNQIIPTYMKLVQPYLYPQGAKPVFIRPDTLQHNEEIATRFLLSGTNDSDNEYTVAYFRADAAPPAYSLVFSQHIIAGMESPSETLYHTWINDLRAVKL